MRRRLSWAAVGTSGVLAAIVATTMTTQSDSETERGKIIVPQAEELNGYIPDRDKKPPTVFIPVVPPVAVTSATSTVPPAPPATTPAANPRKPAPPPPPAVKPPPAKEAPSYQDAYWSFWYQYYGNGGSGYRDSDRGDYYRDSDRGDYRYGDRRDGGGRR